MTRSTAPLRQLEDQAPGMAFVQLVRLLTRVRPDRSPLGGWADPAHEAVRLAVPASLTFPPSEVAALRVPEDPNAPVEVDVRFFGLTGPQGVLPHVYTVHALTRSRARDTAFRDFLDLFHHRALSLFYRAWEYHRPAVAAERGDEDRLLHHLEDVAGLGTAGVRRASGDLADSLAYYSGLLALRTRPALGLSQLIGDYFDVPVTAQQFVGEWRPVLDGGQVALGDDGPDGRLGSAVIGTAVYDAHARVRLHIGPLTRAQFDALLPGGQDHGRLCELARLYADDQVGVDARLQLRKEDAPQATLGSAGTPRLGFGTWLRSKPATRDPDDVLMTLC